MSKPKLVKAPICGPFGTEDTVPPFLAHCPDTPPGGLAGLEVLQPPRPDGTMISAVGALSVPRCGGTVRSLQAPKAPFSPSAVDTIAGGVDEDVRADYLACYEGDRFVESMRYVRRYPEELPELEYLLPVITAPATIVNGRHDRVVPVTNAEFLGDRLPNSRVALIDAGHFVWEEAPIEYASIVLESITGGTS